MRLVHITLHAEVAVLPRDQIFAGMLALFHLGSGARIERINWAGDPWPKGKSSPTA